MDQRHDEPLSITDIHDVLSNDRRRRVIELLDDGPIALRSLADDIATIEADNTPAPRAVRQSVYVTLHQNHLPRLDSLGIVEYDDTSKTVVPGEYADEIERYLHWNDPVWSEFYLTVAVLGLTLTLTGYLGTPLFATFDSTLYAMTALAVLLGAFYLQLLERGRRRPSVS